MVGALVGRRATQRPERALLFRQLLGAARGRVVGRVESWYAVRECGVERWVVWVRVLVPVGVWGREVGSVGVHVLHISATILSGTVY